MNAPPPRSRRSTYPSLAPSSSARTGGLPESGNRRREPRARVVSNPEEAPPKRVRSRSSAAREGAHDLPPTIGEERRSNPFLQ